MHWLQKLPLHLIMKVLCYPAAVIAVLLFSSEDKRHLTKWIWLETIDQDLTGDSGWKEEHLIGSDPLSAVNRIRWLWRNGGNRLNYEVWGVTDDADFRLKAQAEPLCPYYKRDDGAWLFRTRFSLGFKDLEVFIGWALLGPQLGLCKYVFTIRLKSKDATYTPVALSVYAAPGDWVTYLRQQGVYGVVLPWVIYIDPVMIDDAYTCTYYVERGKLMKKYGLLKYYILDTWYRFNYPSYRNPFECELREKLKSLGIPSSW